MSIATVNPKTAGATIELYLRPFLETLEQENPRQLIRVSRPVDPARYEVTAVLKHLENRGKFPLVQFERPQTLHGNPSPYPLLSNIYATRERCAVALGLPPEQAGMALSIEYARRLTNPLPPVLVDRSQAPVKEVVAREEACDLRNYPIVRHHEMDPGPYIDMTPVMR